MILHGLVPVRHYFLSPADSARTRRPPGVKRTIPSISRRPRAERTVVMGNPERRHNSSGWRGRSPSSPYRRDSSGARSGASAGTAGAASPAASGRPLRPRRRGGSTRTRINRQPCTSGTRRSPALQSRRFRTSFGMTTSPRRRIFTRRKTPSPPGAPPPHRRSPPAPLLSACPKSGRPASGNPEPAKPRHRRLVARTGNTESGIRNPGCKMSRESPERQADPVIRIPDAKSKPQ